MAHSLVQDFAELLASIATRGGGRTSLAELHTHFFHSLIQALLRRDIPQQIIADMLGISATALRRHLKRIRHDKSQVAGNLWLMLYHYIHQQGQVSRNQLAHHFHQFEELSLASCLRDMVKSELVCRNKSKGQIFYQVIDGVEFERLLSDAAEVESHFLWVVIHRYGPITLNKLSERLAIKPQRLIELIESMVQAGDIDVCEQTGHKSFRVVDFDIQATTTTWESAVYNHLSAVFETIRMRLDERETPFPELLGGSVYSFDLWNDHPMKTEITELILAFRNNIDSLWEDLIRYNQNNQSQQREVDTLTHYFGTFSKRKLT